MANAGDPKPTYIYKLISRDFPPPDPLPAALPVSSLDASSGFVHLSTAQQVPNTLKTFFGSECRMYILRLAYDVLEPQIRWEDPKAEVCGPRGGEGMFPHLYNGLKLGKDQVESVRTWDRAEGESWDDVLGRAADWLVY
ncbi:hypothetical protein SCP_0303890 [Sparassis crispa]|uniref:DUF952 domain-containing protein n=1 Tax=Sparassis crispa TaxID=139825 RepID=A0A401GES9_9APHY|nr:hypothetical protein SCP_0303890 [Sparassis crispa]GBE80670.1 hypothetical protein SCP_0303890 [Sparassis crispa]